MGKRRPAVPLCATSVPPFTCAFVFLLLVVGADAEQEDAASSKVKVSVYYESLCPDSHMFITNQLYPTWKELSDIMILDLYAYGKAHETEEDGNLLCNCQHGPIECQGNRMLTCAKKYMPDVNDFIEFSNCVMSEFRGSVAGLYCAKQVDVDFNDTEHCLKSKEGERLVHDVGVAQATLEPSLNYVPWILINDEYITEVRKECQQDLRKVVCDAYKGPKPAGCSATEEGRHR